MTISLAKIFRSCPQGTTEVYERSVRFLQLGRWHRQPSGPGS